MQNGPAQTKCAGASKQPAENPQAASSFSNLETEVSKALIADLKIKLLLELDCSTCFFKLLLEALGVVF